MQKCLALVLLVTLSWIGGLAQDARAGVTIDVVFQDATTPSGHWATPGAPGPGCVFQGYYGKRDGSGVSWGHCMDVILTSTVPMVSLSMSVIYESYNGLALAAMYEWKGVAVGSGKQSGTCSPTGGLADNGGILQSFDCSIAVPVNPPVLPAGTYRIGTIVWDTSGWFFAGQETILTYIDDLVDGVGAIINGNVIFLTSADIVARSHYLRSDPPCGNGVIDGWEGCDDGNWTSGDGCADGCQVESGWTCVGEPSVCTEDPVAVPSMSAMGATVLGVAVFGIGLVGLVITARRRRN